MQNKLAVISESLRTQLLSENDRAMFDRFSARIYGGTRIKPTSADDALYRRAAMIWRYASIVLILTIMTLAITGSFRSLPANLRLPIFLCDGVIVAAALFMIFFPTLAKQKRWSGRTMGWICTIYSVAILAYDVVITVAQNVAAADGALLQTGATAVCIFLVTLAPLPSKQESAVIVGALVTFCFVPLFLPGSENHSAALHFFLHGCAILCYIVQHMLNEREAQKLSDLGALNDELLLSSFTDGLTGTFNRRALDRYLESLSSDEKIKSIGVMIFDIDNFKSYNDIYSHSAGDNAIRRVCGAAKKVAYANGHYIFRYGGEEFVIIAENPADLEIVRLAGEVRSAVAEENIFYRESTVLPKLTITIGCAKEMLTEEHNDDFIVSADRQLQIGKTNGKNCVVYKSHIYH